MTHEEWIGTVTHYFPKAHAAAVHLDLGELHLGDEIHIKGPGVDLRQRVDSLQQDREPIQGARAGQEVGIELANPVPENADVFVVRDA